MKIIILSCLAAVAFAAPQFIDEDRPPVLILRDDRVDHGDGNFQYAFEADNGLNMEVIGTPGDNSAVNMQGHYDIPLPDGRVARITFIADGNGFQPQGDIIPTPHPLPAHAIEQIRLAEEQRAAGIEFDVQGRRLN